MYDANIMKKSSRFYLKYNPDNRWSFWTGKWWSLCSEISGQFTPKLGGQFDRLFHCIGKAVFKNILFNLFSNQDFTFYSVSKIFLNFVI